jgi:hypothetical protein
MFLGHYGLAFAAKPLSKKTSLGSLTFAAQLADLLWPLLLIAGIEEVRVVPGILTTSPLEFVNYPISHSLLSGVIGGLLVGAIYWVIRKDLRGAWVMGGLVTSHWFLDLPFHGRDLPIWPGGPKVGFSLWNSWPATLISEFGLFALGIWLYLRATRARDGVGRWAFWGFVAFLALGYSSTLLGPPPASASAIAWSAVILWLFVPWTAWFDRHRSVTVEAAEHPAESSSR